MTKTSISAAVPPASREAAHEALASIGREWNAAARTWDVDALASLYTEDSTMFAGRPGIGIGTADMRKYFASYAGILRSTQLDLIEQYMVQLAPGVFLAQGYGHFHFTLAHGKQAESKLRTTLILVRREGKWKILQHHFSATPEVPPIPGEDRQAV